MADKAVTVQIPEDRVPEFYLWVAAFLAAEPGATPGPAGFGPGGPGGLGHGPGGHRGMRGGPFGRHAEPAPWTDADGELAAWLYNKLAPPARALFDALIDADGGTIRGDALASQLGLEKGAHGVAGILAWPGRYCRKLGRELPVVTTGRQDGGTDYAMDPSVAQLFRAARS